MPITLPYSYTEKGQEGNLSNRPVITLNSNTLINNGNGTVEDPYIVK